MGPLPVIWQRRYAPDGVKVCQPGSHRAVYPSDAGTSDVRTWLRDGEVFAQMVSGRINA